MPQVFTGTVAIPGDQVEADLAALAEAQEARRPCRQSLEGLRAEFAQPLAARYRRQTVREHAQIVALFVDFLCDDADVTAIEEVSRGMANSAFRQWYRRKVLGAATADDLRVALKTSFQVLATEQGIHNPQVVAPSGRAGGADSSPRPCRVRARSVHQDHQLAAEEHWSQHRRRPARADVGDPAR